MVVLLIGAAILSAIIGKYLEAGAIGLIVVLFALILAVGMLVDDAIIVSEYAERRMAEGVESRLAFSMAAKRAQKARDSAMPPTAVCR